MLSIVVVAFNIPRELPRTLVSLSVGYQRGVAANDYEVLVVDNGSTPAIDEAVFAGLQGQFRLVRIDDAPVSPAYAANIGLKEAQGDSIGVLIDGARLVSPGFVRFALAGSRMSPRSAIVTLGWYLGYDFQQHALQSGWTRADEDALLQIIDWPHDGYRLFEIATMDESSVDGWFEPLFESNALFLPRGAWNELAGFDERFTSAGGGLVNHDTFRRAAQLAELEWAILVGEATFHQVHHGISTNATLGDHEQLMQVWTQEYRDIRECEVELVELPNPVLLGSLPPPLLTRFWYALHTSLYNDGTLVASGTMPVTLPDPTTANNPVAAQWIDLALRAAQDGRATEALTYARWGRQVAAEVGDAGPLLAFASAAKSADLLPAKEFAEFHARAGLLCVDAQSFDNAAAHFAEALRVEPGNALARVGISRMRMPGVTYDEVLRWVHADLKPVTYLEIGVAEGGTLALAKPPTIAVGVDPVPAITQPIAVQHHVFPETSADFFEHHDVHSMLGGAPALVFIDGLHTFPAVLKDFWQVEATSSPSTLVMLHDTIPLDEITQRPQQVYEFYTGDVWKLLHCLAEVRPDLSLTTVRTPPSGLTLVTGLNPKSTVLRDRYDELVARYGALTFEDAAAHPGALLDNRRDAVGAWLSAWRQRQGVEKPRPLWYRILRRGYRRMRALTKRA